VRRLLAGIFFAASITSVAENMELKQTLSADANGYEAYSVWLMPQASGMDFLNRAIRRTTDMIHPGAATLDAHVTLIGLLRFQNEGDAKAYMAQLFEALKRAQTVDKLTARFDSVHRDPKFFQNTVIRLTEAQGLYEANRIAVDLYNKYRKEKGLEGRVPAAAYMEPEDGKSNRFHLSLAYGDKPLTDSQLATVERLVTGEVLGTKFTPCTALLYQLGPEYARWPRVGRIDFK
jgi:hypothetical protein